VIEHTGETETSDYVELRFTADSNGTGQLSAAARASGFAGRSHAWFDTTSLTTFARLLAEYPIPNDPAPRLAGGIWRRDRPNELSEEHLALEAMRIGSLGQISLRVHLAAGGPGAPSPVTKNDVRLELLTTYERMRRFSEDLLEVIRGERSVARLDGELMAGSGV
jgi:hypothetical protein